MVPIRRYAYVFIFFAVTLNYSTVIHRLPLKTATRCFLPMVNKELDCITKHLKWAFSEYKLIWTCYKQTLIWLYLFLSLFLALHKTGLLQLIPSKVSQIRFQTRQIWICPLVTITTAAQSCAFILHFPHNSPNFPSDQHLDALWSELKGQQ